MSEGYLEPVVVRVVGDIRDLIAKIKEAQALLDDFSKTVSTAHLSADYKMVTEAIAAADAELQGFSKQVFDANLGANAQRVLATISTAESEGKAFAAQDFEAKLGVVGTLVSPDGTFTALLQQITRTSRGLSTAGDTVLAAQFILL